MKRLVLAAACALSVAAPAGAAPSVGTQNSNSVSVTGGTISGADVSGASVLAPGSTVARTEAQRAGGCDASGAQCYVFHARDYGVHCDGADTTAGLQALAAAVKANTAGGALVELPSGTCTFAGPIAFTGSFITLVGAGIGTALVNTNGSADSIVFSPADPSSGSAYGNAVSNLRITRTADTSGGAALHLIRQIGFHVGDNVNLKEHFGGLLVEGGSDIHAGHLVIGTGIYWKSSTVKAGSYYARFIPAIYGSVDEHPSEIFIEAPNWKTENQQDTGNITPVVDHGLDVEGMDGLWVTGGHIGFTANGDFYATPFGVNEGVQTVFSTGVVYDGNNTGGIGVNVPSWSVTGGYIRDLVFTGGSIEDHTNTHAYVNAPAAADIRFDNVSFFAAGGWCADIEAAQSVSVSGNFKQCATAVNNTGGLKIANVTTANIGEINFDGVASGANASITGGVCMYLNATGGQVLLPVMPTFNNCPTNARMLIGGDITLRLPAMPIFGIGSWQNVLFMQPSAVSNIYASMTVDANIISNTSFVGSGVRKTTWVVNISNGTPTTSVVGSDVTQGSPAGFQIGVSNNNLNIQVNSADQGAHQIASGTADLTLHLIHYGNLMWQF